MVIYFKFFPLFGSQFRTLIRRLPIIVGPIILAGDLFFTLRIGKWKVFGFFKTLLEGSWSGCLGKGYSWLPWGPLGGRN